MPTITVDGQSLAIDGRRLWIVSGTICYHRVPSALWVARIVAAKQAGLNCIETPVVWSLHEPRSGVFKFDGDLDLAVFIRLVGAAKMHCILRMGPYVGDGMDLGGLPAWLLKSCGGTAGKLRSGAAEFLQPVSRYFSAVCDRVQSLQASQRKAGGPIIAVQNEHRWMCGSAAQSAAYLGETNRYLRENGINVPILSANELFASAEGEVEVWAGSSHLHANLRQLRALKPDQPRVVMGLPTCERGVWGREASLPRLAPGMDSPPPPRGRGSFLMRAIGEVLAAGGQFNLSPFHGGTNFGFLGGRFADAEGSFATTSAAAGSPLGEAGERGETYSAVRRICTFAWQFGRVFSGLDPAYQPAIVSLDSHPTGMKKGKATTDEASLVAVECRGSQGSVVFVFGPAEGEAVRRRATILLADGSTLPKELEGEPVGWMLLDTHLAGRSTLDYCNLNAFALVGRVFVCYGPAGMAGVMSINGSAFEVVVPAGAEPHVSEHEDVTVVVCNGDSVDAVWVDGSAVYVGASGMDLAGHPIAHPSYKKVTRIAGTGEMSSVAGISAARKKTRIVMGAWSACGTDEFVKGKSERYASIDGPTGLATLGAASGYGWVRLKFKGMTKSVKGGFFEAADRLHLYFDGEFHSLIGVGPGGEEPVVSLPFKKGEHVVTALIDNLGRRCEGDGIGERKGLFGHVVEATVFRAGSPKIESEKSIEPLMHWPVVMGLEDGDATDPRRVTWRIQHRKKTPLIMRVGGLSDPAVLMVDGKSLRVLARGTIEYVVLTPEMLSRGTNEVQVAVVGDVVAALRVLKETVVFYEGEAAVTAKAGWAFAKWEPPGATKFKALSGGGKGASEFKGRPAWWRATFTVDLVGEPLFLEATGLSKGQVFVNGHNAGRYFVATRTGKGVAGQSRYYLPEPWLKVGANELVLFDEHGFSPERCAVVM